MQKFIIGLIASLMMGPLANTASAEAGKDQILISAPLYGNWFTCNYMNVSDEAVWIDYEWALGLGGGSLNSPFGPGSAGRGTDFFKVNSCIIKWFGKADIIKATFCSYSEFDITLQTWVGATCIEMR